MINTVLFNLDAIADSVTNTVQPGVSETIQMLKEKGINIGVVANMPDLYKVMEFSQRVLEVAETLHLEDAVWVFAIGDAQKQLELPHYWDMVVQVHDNLEIAVKPTLTRVFILNEINWRLPRPDMLWFACVEYRCPDTDVIFVGFGDDVLAARAAHAKFVPVEQVNSIAALLEA